MTYTDDFAIIGAAGDDFDCNAITGWTGNANANSPIVLNADSKEGLNSIEMRGTSLITYTHDVGTVDGDRFKITEGLLNVYIRYSKGKGASYLAADGSALVIRLYFGGTTDYADYQPTDNGDESLVFGWNLLQISGKNLNGGSTSGIWSDTPANWERFIHRVEIRVNLANNNDKESEDAPILMDCWFFGKKFIVSEGTVGGTPVDLDDLNDWARNTRSGFPVELIEIREQVLIEMRAGLDVGNGSDGLNNEGYFIIPDNYKALLLKQWSEEVNLDILVEEFSEIGFGTKESGTDGDYAVRGIQVVAPANRYPNITVNAGGRLRAFDTKFFRLGVIKYGDVTDTTSVIELRRVIHDQCDLQQYYSPDMTLVDVETLNAVNETEPHPAEFYRTPTLASAVLFHDNAEGPEFRPIATSIDLDRFEIKDTAGNHLQILTGKEVNTIDSVYDKTKLEELLT